MLARRISEMNMRFCQRARRQPLCGHKGQWRGVWYTGCQKLMEDIPNKVRDMLGILVDVNLKEKDNKQYLEIATEAYPYPISFRGKFFSYPNSCI